MTHITLTPLDATAPKLFGFPEFLTGLALIVLAWTTADIRYRFRVATAPLPLRVIAFVVVASVGSLSLLTDLWRAEHWLVPQGNLITPSEWQALLGGLLLLTFLVWAWFAFIRPPTYGPASAARFARTLYHVVFNGPSSELAVVAVELGRSAGSLVRYSTNREEPARGTEHDRAPSVTAYANDILLLIANKRFCRAIVESAPSTAREIFREMAKLRKFRIPVAPFARNIVTEALANRDSFLFHEDDPYDSGLLAYHKPLSSALFSDCHLVESVGTLLDPRSDARTTWDSSQWGAYCRIVLMTLRGYAGARLLEHSTVLYRALHHVRGAVGDLYRINSATDSNWNDHDVQARLRVVVEFIQECIRILNRTEVPSHLRLRVRGKDSVSESFYDDLAEMIADVAWDVSAVRSPAMLCWWIQHNGFWARLFNCGLVDGPAASVIKFKVRRHLYDKVVEMERWANFGGARILGFCLNVMGLTIKRESYNRDSRALQKAILSWTKRHYAWLHSFNPRVAEACLVDGMTFEERRLRIVKTYPAEGLRRIAEHQYFSVDAPAVADGAHGG